MELKFNLDKVLKIVIEKDEKNVLEYKLENGMIVGVCEYPKNCNEKNLSDREMIEKISHSDFMNELTLAKKRYKLSKEIDEQFPKITDGGQHKKDPMRLTSDESLNIAKEIIKKDLDGTLDKIIQKRFGEITSEFKNNVEQSFDEDEKLYDMSVCRENMKKIENKLLSLIQKNPNKNILENDEFLKTLNDYEDYGKKYDELIKTNEDLKKN